MIGLLPWSPTIPVCIFVRSTDSAFGLIFHTLNSSSWWLADWCSKACAEVILARLQRCCRRLLCWWGPGRRSIIYLSLPKLSGCCVELSYVSLSFTDKSEFFFNDEIAIINYCMPLRTPVVASGIYTTWSVLWLQTVLILHFLATLLRIMIILDLPSTCPLVNLELVDTDSRSSATLMTTPKPRMSFHSSSSRMAFQ